MLALLSDPDAWAALVTLTALEIVLGIDNVVFISVLVARLPEQQAKKARQIGLLLALAFRIALLFALLIGVALVADGFDFHIPRGYIYSAMAFAGVVEAINVTVGGKRCAK